MMEEINTTETNFNLFLERFLQYFPGITDPGKHKMKKEKGYSYAYLSFLIPHKIEEMKTILKENQFVNILYSIKSEDNKACRILAYSMPYDTEMYAILLESEMYGIIDGMSVVFYESLDVMFNQLNESYRLSQNQCWQIEEIEKPEVFFSNFV